MRQKKDDYTGFIDPYVTRWDEVVLTGWGENGKICYQQLLTYSDYYEEDDHVFDSAQSLASKGIRRLHFVIWDLYGKMQAEAMNEYDAEGKGVRGWRRDSPDMPWTEY
ncbi:MAG: hypothetical protein ICCCNLDF_00788 [Planctomycetes bacterium]|nr:hypothetical protein [Planctomycetota bacterium]